jgi:hypothetical protein
LPQSSAKCVDANAKGDEVVKQFFERAEERLKDSDRKMEPSLDQPTETVSISFAISTLDDIHNAILWLRHLVLFYESIESESNMALAMRVRLMKNAARIASEGLQDPPPID